MWKEVCGLAKLHQVCDERVDHVCSCVELKINFCLWGSPQHQGNNTSCRDLRD